MYVGRKIKYGVHHEWNKLHFHTFQFQLNLGQALHVHSKSGGTLILSNFYLDLDQAPLSLGNFYPDIQLKHLAKFLPFSSW